ncbi:phosphatidylserine/phosphatidylglycerophosphate/cardiolipin synthase family protein [Pseudomonas sp. PDM31]|uniref:phospholipase D-like domain-containing protein n=1 Tax=Pseudomonas sp. PDM31 TaxID=2854778 RepID=UPI001C43B1F5|nr:phospholipase D-like domain-containing protein [Pseudomonas sp. PDM31]MBV7479678.1 phospholipase [Pseudomonas sp. PDM31]
MTLPTIKVPIATSKTTSCQLNLPWFVQCTEYDPAPATFEPLVNGERAFGSVYDAIEAAKSSVEIICWGFQPSMHFKRGKTSSLCIGDLLIKKAHEGVQVRILCWYDTLRLAQTSENPTPGDNVSNWFGTYRQNRNDAQVEYDKLWYRQIRLAYTGAETGPVELGQRFFRLMRWGNDLSPGTKNIEFVTRDFSLLERAEIAWRLTFKALDKDRDTTNKVMSSVAMVAEPSHHQKMVLVDYEQPQIAVGFVMGHNTLDAYWDNDDHSHVRHHAQFGRNGETPRQDISSRVSGPVLEFLNDNFCAAWKKETRVDLLGPRQHIAEQLRVRPGYGPAVMAQILRTQSQENIRDIEKVYLKAVNNTTRFIYIENQYFRWPPLADKIKSVVQNLLNGGRDLEKDGPVYLFVVTNSSSEAMGDGSVNTFRMLKRLGRPQLMPGVARAERRDDLLADLAQARLAERLASINAGIFKDQRDTDHDQTAARYYETLKGKLEQARARVAQLEKEFPEKDQAVISPTEIPGLKVHICTLVAPDSPPENWMDVYVHSKLMIVDDVFTTLGSANINTRSMQVDSELNICIEDPAVTRPLREHLFGVHTGGRATGDDMYEVYDKWQDIINQNRDRKTNGAQKQKTKIWEGPIASLIEFMQESPIRKDWD